MTDREMVVMVGISAKLQREAINDVLDKIRAEIENASEDLDGYDPDALPTFVGRVEDIIDKYRKETE